MIDWHETRLRINLWLMQSWPLRLPAMLLLSKHVPECKDFGEFGGNQEPCRSVDATVFAVLHEFKQVRVESSDGHQYAITAKTSGVDFDDLQVGQRLQLTVDGRGKVLHSELAGDKPGRPVPTMTPAQIALHGGITASNGFSVENAEKLYSRTNPMLVKAKLAEYVDALKANEVQRKNRLVSIITRTGWLVLIGSVAIAAVRAVLLFKK